MAEDRQVYGVNASKAKETKQRIQEESQRNLLPMWKIPEGITKIRILPPWSEAGEVAYESASHWKIPPNDRMLNCLRVIGKECPLCEMVTQLRRDAGADKALKQKANAFGAKKSIYYNIIVRGEEEKGVQIMRSGIKLYENILSYLYDADYGDVTSLEEGMDATLERTGQGLDTSYTIKFGPKQTPLHENEKLVQTWVNGMFDLDTIMEYKDALELEEAVKNISGAKSTTVKETEVTDGDNTVVPEEEAKEESPDNKKKKLTDQLDDLLNKDKE
jgi:hypothetical protein